MSANDRSTTPSVQPLVTVREDVIRFLLGEAPFDGHWYGEKPLAKAMYWWRTPLRQSMHQFSPASESAPPTDLALEYAERKGFIEGCTEGYPGIAHDLETMRAALVAVSESHVSAYGKDRGICYVRPDTLEKVRDAIKNAAPQETQQADRLRTNRLKDRDESGPGESPAVAAPSSPSSAKHAAPQAGTPEEPSGRASASQDPVRDTEPAGAASCSTANSATACSKCGGMGQTMDGHPCSSCGGAGR